MKKFLALTLTIVIIACTFTACDLGTAETSEDEFILELASGKTAVALINKTDKECMLSPEFMQKIDTGCHKTIFTSAIVVMKRRGHISLLDIHQSRILLTRVVTTTQYVTAAIANLMNIHS